MTIARLEDIANKQDLLRFLSALKPTSDDVDIVIQGLWGEGHLSVRGGVVVKALSGDLVGNGALLSVITQNNLEVHVQRCEDKVVKNLTVNAKALESFLKKISSISSTLTSSDANRLVAEAVDLLYQFRRKEAGSRLVQLLKSNRFFYPAWLWQSRLMGHKEHIIKALNEARKWGNADPLIVKESALIQEQIAGIQGDFKRCFFCWSLVAKNKNRCGHCRGKLTMSPVKINEKYAGDVLHASLLPYKQQWEAHPQNRKIAYCLSLGYRSLGDLDTARKYLSAALELSPREPLFLNSLALLKADRPAPGRAQAGPEKKVVAPPTKQKPLVPQGEDGKTILVVEDSKTSRKVISLVLHRKGFTVQETTTGAEALESLKTNRPDLVLLDVMLPDMTGYQILEVIKKSKATSEVPVVMLTGKKGSSDRMRGMVGGASEYLTKPFDPAKLLAVIEKHLEKPESTEIKKSEPVKKKKVVVSPPKPITPAPVAETKSLPRHDKYVLVVEDSPTARKVITTVLSRNGYVVEAAATGKQALEFIATKIPQVLLLDTVLPDMTGYDILSYLKRNDTLESVPVIMLTSKDSPVDRQRGVKAGASAYLTKPFDPAKLLVTIKSHIKNDTHL